jgi:hypothetical protein
VHWTPAKQGEILEYLALNTTENSTTLWNYRQRECAFWTEYLPTVIGYITPTYPPTTEVGSFFKCFRQFENQRYVGKKNLKKFVCPKFLKS